MKAALSAMAQAIGVVLIVLWMARACQENAERADLYRANWRASQDTTRELTDSLRVSGRVFERLALQLEELEADTSAASKAIAQRERQLRASVEFVARLQLQRDSLAAALIQIRSNEDSTTFARDTAGVRAEVTLRPGVRPGTQADMRLLFEPTEVVLAALRSGKEASILALTDSLHRARFSEPPQLRAPKKPGRFGTGCSGPVTITRHGWDLGVGCGLTVRLP